MERTVTGGPTRGARRRAKGRVILGGRRVESGPVAVNRRVGKVPWRNWGTRRRRSEERKGMKNRDLDWNLGWEGTMERNETTRIRYEMTKTRETAMGKRSETTRSLDETLNTIRKGAAMRERDETTMIRYEKTRNIDEIQNTIRGETTRRRRKTRLEEERHTGRRKNRGAKVYGRGAVVRRIWARRF